MLPKNLKVDLLHLGNVTMGLQGMLRSGKFISSLCADENGLFIFLGRKKETNLANWSEVNRNGLKVSLDLEDNNIIV